MERTRSDIVDSLGSLCHTLDQVRERLDRPPRGHGGGLQANHYFRRLLDISRRMTSTPERDGVLSLAIETLVELFAAEKGFLALRDDDGELTFRVAVDADSGTIDEATVEVSRSVVEEAVDTRSPILVENALEDERFRDKASVIELGLRSAMCVPLIGADGVLGVIYVDHRLVEGKFADSDLQFLALFANQVTAALENARLFEETRRRAGAMELLYRVSRTGLAKRDVDSMLRLMAEQVEVIGYANGAAVVRETAGEAGDTPASAVCAASGLAESLADALAASGGPGLSGQGTEAALVCDLEPSPFREACLQQGIVQVAAASLGAAGPSGEGEQGSGVKGTLVAVRREPREFTVDDLNVLGAMAAEMGLAVHNAELYVELEQAYEDLQAAQSAIREQERLRALGTMASGIAHDINNSLSPIVGFAELLARRSDLDEDAQRQLKFISTSADDIAATVARLREFYRRRDTDELLVPVPVAELIHNTLSLTRPRWEAMPQERGVVIRVREEIDAGVPAVLGTEGEIREVLINLILNAVDAMPSGGDLTITARPEGEWVVVTVSDTGLGMAPEVRQQCLEPFFTTKGVEGTGLGMSVVHGIIRRHNGRLDIDTAPGQGTVVSIWLPATREQRAAPVEEDLEGIVSLRALCVDDEPMVLQYLAEALESLGHTVTTADSGRAAIELFDPEAFDVVITDLGMPEVDGRTVVADIRSRAEHVPVIVVTGWATVLRPEETPPGATAVLCKPVGAAELQQTLTDCCVC